MSSDTVLGATFLRSVTPGVFETTKTFRENRFETSNVSGKRPNTKMYVCVCVVAGVVWYGCQFWLDSSVAEIEC